MHRPMKAPSARNSMLPALPAPTVAASVAITPMAIEARAQYGSKCTRRCFIIVPMLRSSRTRIDLAIVFAIAVVSNFSYLTLSNGDFYYPDSFTYLTPAANILHGLGFVDETRAAETIRTPGYPLLLVLFGARTLPVIIFQHLLNAGLAIAIYLFVIHRMGDRLIALVASLLFALDTPTIHYANKLLTETLFTVLLYVVFVLALQRPRPIVIGILSGILVLIRPIAIFFFVAVAIFFVLHRIPARTLIA